MTNQESSDFMFVGSFFAALALILGVVGAMEFEDAKQEEAIYCQNVKAWKKGDHSYGYPDYKHIYKEVCENGNHS